MKISHESIIKLHPIEIRQEEKHYIVEDKTTTEFYEMPLICIEAITRIQDGQTLGEIERELVILFPEEEVNLVEFAEQLLELELVHEVDGVLVELRDKSNPQLGFSWISPKIGQFFFHPIIRKGYLLLFLINIIIFILNPNKFPHFKDAFIFEYMFQNILTWIVISGVLVLIHEFGHILAIRSHGLPTKLEIGHRLFLVVLETDLSLAWKLPKKERISLYLSGMSFDNLLLFIALIIQLIFPNSSELLLGIMAFIVLDIVIRMIYQCCVYLKTDLYYVLENILASYNLMENAKMYFKNRLTRRRSPIEHIYKGEEKIVAIYGGFYLIGVSLSLFLFSVFYVPQLLYMVGRVLPGLSQPLNSVTFWDSTVIFFQLALVLFLLSRSYLKNRH